MGVKKSILRGVVPSVLEGQGYAVASQSGQGLLPGSRLLATKKGKQLDVAVKILLERRMSFTKQSATKWRTLGSVDLVVAVAPVGGDSDDIEVLAFDAEILTSRFDEAWKILEKANRALSFETPIFVPLDEVSRKNLGHNIANLKAVADWSNRLSLANVTERSAAAVPETFIDRVKREFAEKNGVDVSKVVVEFRIVS